MLNEQAVGSTSRGRASLHSVEEWWRLIRTNPLFAHIRARVELTPFFPLLDLKYPQGDRVLHLALGERWWSTTHTFHFPVGEIGISPLDFVAMTGIGFGGNRLDLDSPEWLITDAELLRRLPHIRPEWQSSGTSIRASAITDYKTRMQNYGGYEVGGTDLREGSDESREYTLAFLLYVVGYGFLGTRNGNIRRSFVMVLEGLGRLYQLDWAQAIYSHFIAELDSFSSTTARDPYLTGFYPLLEVWYYEYVGTLHRVLPAPAVFPRFSTWYAWDAASVFTRQSSIQVVRGQIECRFQETIVWRPWRSSDARRRQSFQHALQLSRTRTVFQSPTGVSVLYLGERLWRQFTGRYAVPSPPTMPTLAGVAETLQWEAMHPGQRMDGGTLVTYVSRWCYEVWWSSVSVGSLTSTGVVRSGNLDQIGVGALSQDVVIRQDVPVHTAEITEIGSTPVPPPRPTPDVLRSEVSVYMFDGSQVDILVAPSAFEMPLLELDPHFHQYQAVCYF